MNKFVMLVAAAVLLSCGGRKKAAAVVQVEAPVEYGYEVVAIYPHDPEAYTQGLFWHEGRLWESTGLSGHSTLREVVLETGEAVREAAVEGDYFAEGAVLLGGKIYQLTWQDGVVLVWDPATFAVVERFENPGEGWGLTTDGENLWMSDGTSHLTVVAPDGFRRLRQVNVRAGRAGLRMLNELEWINGKIWANVYMEDVIAIIDPTTGHVEGTIDLSALRTDPRAEALNGIAHDPATGRIFITGKWWNKVYEIKKRP